MPEPTAAPTRRRIRGLDAEQRRAQRREQLLDAALDEFATNGYHSTSIEQICRAAYVSTKSFYDSFASREECYIALLQRTTEQISSKVLAGLEQASDDEATATRELIAGFAHALVDDPRLARVTFGEAAGISPAVERQRRANRRWAADFLEQVWHRFGATGPDATGGIDPHGAAIGAIGGLFEIVADWLHDSDPADAAALDPLIERLTGFYWVVRAGLVRSAGP